MITLLIYWDTIIYLGLAVIFCGIFVFALSCDNNDEDKELREAYRFPGWDEVTDYDILVECKRRKLIEDTVTCDEWGDNTKEGYYKVHDVKEDAPSWLVKFCGIFCLLSFSASLFCIAMGMYSLGDHEREERAVKGEKTEQPADSTHKDNSGEDMGIMWYILGRATRL